MNTRRVQALRQSRAAPLSIAEESAPVGVYSSVPSQPAIVFAGSCTMLSCILSRSSWRSSASSHHGRWMRYPLTTTVRAFQRITQAAMPAAQARRDDYGKNHAQAQQPSPRELHEADFGANFQNGAETGSSNTMHAIAHAAGVFQNTPLLFRSERAAHAAIKSKPISANASQEMRWLKASCSASAVWMKRKLSCGR